MTPELETLNSEAVQVLKCFEYLVAVGMGGSHALGLADKYSDYDLQVFVTEVPPLDRRKEVYSQHGVEAFHLDHPVTEGFENPPCSARFAVDWLRLGGLKCDLLWLPRDDVDRLLSRLPGEPDQREALAVLAQTIQPVFDPRGYVVNMKEHRPEYPKDRARRKASDRLHYGHFFLCEWAVLHKCLFRRDVIAYHQAESEMVGVLIDALYAVNSTWQLDRRRIRFHAKGFHILPGAFLDRLESMVSRSGKHADLEVCHVELLSLFCDLASGANEVHTGWHLPTDWYVNDG